jgi:cyclopropane-fatty-acyl-phospholipid synthase
MLFWATRSLIALIERGLVPDAAIRAGIRGLLRRRLDSLPLDDARAAEAYAAGFVRDLGEAPIALVPEKANEQHYEAPTEFFRLSLGRRMKYSGCFWPEGVSDLDEAEIAALGETCARAELADGQDILELGCGWGSLTLWMAERYPNSRIVAVSNSRTQREYILGRAAEAGLSNLEIVTCDMNDFDIERRFDRVASVEMFEHMRNWPRLFARVAGWLKPEGRFFMHVFCHRRLPYLFEVEDDSDWMSRHFFSGGMMPSLDLPARMASPLALERRWDWSGVHYEKTANAWLANMDRRKRELWPVMAETYGAENARLWWMRWRVFFMACAELFGYREGEEWLVGHYLFKNSAAAESAP